MWSRLIKGRWPWISPRGLTTRRYPVWIEWWGEVQGVWSGQRPVFPRHRWPGAVKQADWFTPNITRHRQWIALQILIRLNWDLGPRLTTCYSLHGVVLCHFPLLLGPSLSLQEKCSLFAAHCMSAETLYHGDDALCNAYLGCTYPCWQVALQPVVIANILGWLACPLVAEISCALIVHYRFSAECIVSLI